MSEHQDNKLSLRWQHWALIVGSPVLLVIVLLVMPVLTASGQAGPRWETVIDEQFDQPLSSGWIMTDTGETDGGVYHWGSETFTYTSAITGLWSVGGGAEGGGLTAGVSTYVDNVDSWLIYGPLNVSAAFEGALTFDWWLDTPAGSAGGPGFFTRRVATAPPSYGDWLGWCVLTDVDDLEACQGV